MKKIELSKGFVALVDDEDFDKISQYKWHYHFKPNRNTNYARTYIGKIDDVYTKQYMHRMIMKPADGQAVDHIDGNGLNNQRSNLRLATTAANARNAKKRSGSTSKYKGVSWYPNRNQWVGNITINYKRIHLGYFDTETDAAKAYNKKALEINPTFSRINELPL